MLGIFGYIILKIVLKELEKTRKRLRTLDLRHLRFPFVHAARNPLKFFVEYRLDEENLKCKRYTKES